MLFSHSVVPDILWTHGLPCPSLSPGVLLKLMSITLEKEIATHSSILALRIPWTEEPGRLMSQFSSVVQSCLTLFDLMNCTTPGLPAHHQLPELPQTHVYWVGDAIQPFHPVIAFSSHLQSFPASWSFPVSQLFASSGQKYWSFSFSISTSNEYSGLVSFCIDCFDLLAIQRTLKTLLSTMVRKHQVFSAQRSLWSNSHIHIWLLEKP